MNLYPSFRYQLSRERTSILVYYGVWFCLVVLSVLVNLFVVFPASDSSDSTIVVTNGNTAATAIFTFVTGLCAFKENFAMSLQNGVTRKTLFGGRLCVAAALCLLMSAADEVIVWLMVLISKLPRMNTYAESLAVTLYGFRGGIPENFFARAALCIGFNFFLLLFFTGLGYCISALYYRLNTPGKVAVSVSVPAFFIVGVPVLKMLRDQFHLHQLYQALADGLWKLLVWMFGTPYAAMLSFFVLFCIVSLFAWLLIRRAALKK